MNYIAEPVLLRVWVILDPSCPLAPNYKRTCKCITKLQVSSYLCDEYQIFCTFLFQIIPQYNRRQRQQQQRCSQHMLDSFLPARSRLQLSASTGPGPADELGGRPGPSWWFRRVVQAMLPVWTGDWKSCTIDYYYYLLLSHILFLKTTPDRLISTRPRDTRWPRSR